MASLYSYKGDDIPQFRQTYGALVRQEFYDGEVEIDPSDQIEFDIQKTLSRPISLMRIRSTSGISMRRSWNHIRQNRVSSRVFWFIESGKLQLDRSNGTCDAESGQCVIVDTGVPFYGHAMAADQSNFDAILCVVPDHLFVTHLAPAISVDQPFDVGLQTGEPSRTLLDLLYRSGPSLGQSAAESLSIGFLQTLSDNVGDQKLERNIYRRLTDKRNADIRSIIKDNLTNTDFSAGDLARECDISKRYLCRILREAGTSFSDLLWSQRLDLAHSWLGMEAMDEHSISEIAYMVGFKSPAHFSRKFKETFGVNPTWLRERKQA